MELSALSKILWEQVKAEKRTIEKVIPETMKDQVIERARIDVQNEIISESRFLELTGISYQ